MQMQGISVRTTCRTHQARATTAVRCKFELKRCMPCSLALLSQRSAAHALRLTIKARSCTCLRHCQDRLVPVNKTAPGRLRCRSRSTYKFATRSKGEATPEALAQGTRWKSKLPWFLSSLFAVGAVLGPALDGIHGTVHLLTYDSGQFDMAGVQSSGWVGLLLGTFYAVIGALHIIGDHWQDTEAWQTAQTMYRKQTVPYVMASIGTVALLLYTSAILYANNIDYTQIAVLLLLLASVNFKLFEDTKQGLALAILCACAAPVSELIIMNVFGLWHYPHPNVFQEFGRGLPGWVSVCYLFYSPAVGNTARLIWKHM
ncbi:TPA: hypothetical protein ACH3X1_009566 [Trebouxia sp. C0004]